MSPVHTLAGSTPDHGHARVRADGLGTCLHDVTVAHTGDGAARRRYVVPTVMFGPLCFFQQTLSLTVSASRTGGGMGMAPGPALPMVHQPGDDSKRRRVMTDGDEGSAQQQPIEQSHDMRR